MRDTLTAARLVRQVRAKDAFSGEGARLYGGRWNSPGHLVVYAADSLALAALEVLVHVLPFRNLEFVAFRIEIPRSLIAEAPGIPENWNATPPIVQTTTIGDQWLVANNHPVLRVPSAVVPGEFNFLINPRHEKFPLLQIQPAIAFRFDRRLAKS